MEGNNAFFDFSNSSEEDKKSVDFFEQPMSSLNFFEDAKSMDVFNQKSCRDNSPFTPMEAEKESKKGKCREQLQLPNSDMLVDDGEEKSNELPQQQSIEEDRMSIDSSIQEFEKNIQEEEIIEKTCEEIEPNSGIFVNDLEEEWTGSFEEDMMSLGVSMLELEEEDVDEESLQLLGAASVLMQKLVKENAEKEKPEGYCGENQSKIKDHVDNLEDDLSQFVNEGFVSMNALLEQFKEKDETDENEDLQIIEENMGAFKEILTQEHNKEEETSEGGLLELEKFLGILKEIMDVKQDEKKQLSEEDQDKFKLLLQEKIQEMNAEEESLKKSYEEIQSECNKVHTMKYKINERITMELSKPIEGEVTTDAILNMTLDTCDTLTKLVLDILDNEKVNEDEMPVMPQPQDEFTMMCYHEMVGEIDKLNNENEQIMQNLQIFLCESKAEIQKRNNICKELKEETTKLKGYLAEMRREEKKLQRELQGSPSESDTDFDLSGLEEEINKTF